MAASAKTTENNAHIDAKGKGKAHETGVKSEGGSNPSNAAAAAKNTGKDARVDVKGKGKAPERNEGGSKSIGMSSQDKSKGYTSVYIPKHTHDDDGQNEVFFDANSGFSGNDDDDGDEDSKPFYPYQALTQCFLEMCSLNETTRKCRDRQDRLRGEVFRLGRMIEHYRCAVSKDSWVDALKNVCVEDMTMDIDSAFRYCYRKIDELDYEIRRSTSKYKYLQGCVYRLRKGLGLPVDDGEGSDWEKDIDIDEDEDEDEDDDLDGEDDDEPFFEDDDDF